MNDDITPLATLFLSDQHILYTILEHLEWDSRMKLLLTCKSLSQFLHNPSLWRFFCHILEHQHYVCVVPKLSSSFSWKDVFLHHFTLKHLWSSIAPIKSPSSSEPETFKIEVGVRFRPLTKEIASEEIDEDEVQAIIPLHQRLQMIRAQHQCSASEARRILWSSGDSSYQSPLDHIEFKQAIKGIQQEVASCSLPQTDQTNITSEDEIGNENLEGNTDSSKLPTKVQVGVLSVDSERAAVTLCLPSIGLKRFKLDQVFESTSSQQTVFDAFVIKNIQSFMNGRNVCVLAYGQTGSGKTHTMFGADGCTSATVMAPNSQSGIIPRAIHQILHALERRRNLKSFDTTLKVSALEVFGDQVFNLLDENESKSLGQQRMGARAAHRGDAEIEIESVLQVEKMLQLVENNRRRAATAMNLRSSRAHTIIMIKLCQLHVQSGMSRNSIFCFADLGGSEKLKQSKVSGERMQEAVQINLGLLALKSCISALKRRQAHVPFQSSTLTYVLESALTGGSLTSIMVNATLAQAHTSETHQSLRFGELCRRVRHNLEDEEEDGLAVALSTIADLNKEIEALETQIQKEERWVNKVVQREDQDGVETFVKSVLEGAEELRERYEQLLKVRKDLVGF